MWERVIKTFYQTFWASFIVSLIFNKNALLNSLTVSSLSVAMCGVMNLIFREFDEKGKSEKKVDNKFLQNAIKESKILENPNEVMVCLEKLYYDNADDENVKNALLTAYMVISKVSKKIEREE